MTHPQSTISAERKLLTQKPDTDLYEPTRRSFKYARKSKELISISSGLGFLSAFSRRVCFGFEQARK